MKARAAATTVILWLALAGPAGAAADASGIDALADRLNRITSVRAETGEPLAERFRVTSRLACEALGGILGGPLQSVLDRAYANLEAHYDAALPLLESAGRYGELLDRITRHLEVAGVSPAAVAATRTALEDAHDPGRGGRMASYAINLHVGEISTAVCRVHNRLRRGEPVQWADRVPIDSALAALQGLNVIVATSTARLGEPAPEPVAAAATTVAGVLVARAYGGLF